jgi:nucleotide-binding universal stress UspA family protein
MKIIMVATDGSQGADRAVDFAARLAQRFAAALWVVNVNDSLVSAELELGAHIENIGLDEMLDAASRQILSRARDRAHNIGVTAIRLEQRSGNAADEIIEIARNEGADAVVIGKRGRGRLSGMLLGSVSQKIVSLAPCVTIVVP